MTGDPPVPPWPAEDFVCAECGFGFAECEPADVAARLPQLAAEVRSVVEATGRNRLGEVRAGRTWSAIEYLCHLRDVHEASTIRLYRVRTEQQPRLEPLFNDLRATRFRYANRDAGAVLDELDDAVAGCCDELGLVSDWDRTLVRLPGEHRTARWLARAAVHEAVHHLDDLRGLVHPAGGPEIPGV